MGVARHVVVAETDEAALAIARRAYPRWRDSFRWLFARHGAEPRSSASIPPTFDELVALDNGIAGSPATVRDFIAAEIEATGANYLLSWFAFGDMTLAESLRSLELFSREVMPAFADARAAGGMITPRQRRDRPSHAAPSPRPWSCAASARS